MRGAERARRTPRASDRAVARRRSLAANLDPQAVAFYRHVIALLRGARVTFLVGGSWAFTAHTGIEGHTKDLDLFLRPGDIDRALETLAAGGYETELTSPVWIGKVLHGDDLVDLIFSAGNGVSIVDDAWFRHARRAMVLGHRLPLVPREEMIWSKAFLMERNRFDGADVLHLLRSARGAIDGERLLKRFGLHWRVLLAHIVLFDYVYPADRAFIPAPLRAELLSRAAAEAHGDSAQARDGVALCFGTFLSRHAYSADLDEGLVDARRA
jgi:hypothetical protein